ncbi:putative ferric reductase [Motilibacter rhizosphaerae]|uniref:Putative ferric reductase n=2 Tax=Motilibacter rhizosphaerae TaxID=598652 RepID=A0A4V2F4X7_9ACTN|nr:putative ferric reductase [Motilibacter rhizosphaerae]
MTVASLVVVVALWLHDRGVQDLTGSTGTLLTSSGRLLGLLASDLLLVQCLLMARIPWAERRWGQDTLARWHRVLGFTSFWTMAAHVVVITLGYDATSPKGLVAETWDLVWDYPGMLLAVAATACLVMVVVTSVRAARRRLRYESWHLLHLYAYLGVGLALPHQVWTGTDFISSPLARSYWWTLWGAAAVATLVFRVALPLGLSWRHRLEVVRVVPEGPRVVSVHLKGRRLDKLAVEAGQFLVLRFLDGEGWTRANPYSLSASPHPSLLRVTIADAGDGSARARHLRPGTRVLFEGPYGRLTLGVRDDHRRPVVLLGAGVGITPLRALLEELPPEVPATLLVRARDEDEVLFRRELETLAMQRKATVHYLLGPRAGDGSWLPRGWDPSALRRLAPHVAAADVFVCGPTAWADAAAAAAERAGTPVSRVHQERFSW